MNPQVESLTERLGPPSDAGEPLPPGDHPLEIAARRGFGPMSRLGRITWHGQASPCVSCGQLVLRGQLGCDQCGQDLSDLMLARMREHAGPWYVFEHVRPFPGISIQRILRLIRRGLITETSIVRGPATDHQWRFAGETPGLCRYFGRCWQCSQLVTLNDRRCPQCAVDLLPEGAKTQNAVARPEIVGVTAATVVVTASAQPQSVPRPTSGSQTVESSELNLLQEAGKRQSDGRQTAENVHTLALRSEPQMDDYGLTETEDTLPAPEWEALTAALDMVRADDGADLQREEPPRVAGIRASWIAAGLLAVVLIGLLTVTSFRDKTLRNRPVAATPSSTLAPPSPPPAPPANSAPAN